MKNIIIYALLPVVFFMCKHEKSQHNFELIETDFMRFKTHEIPVYIEHKLSPYWFERYKENILKSNPLFKFEHLDSLKYIIVPSINIPIEELKNYRTNILDYLNKGELSINNGQLLVFDNDSLLLKFFIIDGVSNSRDGISKSDFNKYLKKTTLNIFNHSDVYFNITITDGTSIFPISGIFIKKNDEYNVMSPNGTLYSLDEMFKPFYKNQKEFDNFIKNIVKLSLHNLQEK